jgi:hypothetical protein
MLNQLTPIKVSNLLRRISLKRGTVFGFMLLGALLFFEIFNYSTTDFALTDLLGAELKFAGMKWATILSIAFCGIDFAGIARLFTPEQGRDEPAEVWYLFGAWILAAAMNATLTWWGVSVAITSHRAAGSALLGQATLTSAVPVFVAVMVWVIRVLIIGTFSVAGERLFTMADDYSYRSARQQTASRPAAPAYRTTPEPARPIQGRVEGPTPRPVPASSGLRTNVRPEPTYHPVGMSASPRDEYASTRR